MTKQFEIVVLPGDGIGVEVVAEAVKVLRAIEPHLQGVKLNLVEHQVGAGEYLRGGDPLPTKAFSACETADAILLGAMGIPDVRWADGREMAPQIDLRERLDTYAGLRPIRLYHPNDARVRLPAGATIDLLLIRENTEGLFVSRQQQISPDADMVEDRLRVTRRSTERVCRYAFEEARKRRRRVTLVDKANVLPSMVFFRSIFFEVARAYPDVQADAIYVDAAALYLVQKPQAFDVMVTENMFGDILSDLAAGLVGGMGMAPSADIGDRHAVFQPSHGSAPDIAGKGIANPIATILSLSLLLRWLAHPETVRAADAIDLAVADCLSDPGRRTTDGGGKMSTAAMGNDVAARARARIEQAGALLAGGAA